MKTTETEQKPGTVAIEIDTAYLNTCLHFFIEHNIPFEMHYLKHHPHEAGKGVEETIFHASKNRLETLKYDTPKSNRIDELIRMIHDKYMNNITSSIPPKITEIAKEFGLSPSSIKTKFQDIYGKPIYQFYMDKKMEYATELLKKGHTAADVGKKVGYTHPIKFNKMFQKHFGITPFQYKKLHLEKNA